MHIIVDSYLFATIFSSEVKWALAVKIICQINASSCWWAIANSTVVNVDITVCARVARRTYAFVAFSLINTSGTILTGTCSTCIILILTTNTSVILGARAVQGVTKIFAGTTIHTGVSNTTLRRSFASLSVSA
jgi:hypothetical protein